MKGALRLSLLIHALFAATLAAMGSGLAGFGGGRSVVVDLSMVKSAAAAAAEKPLHPRARAIPAAPAPKPAAQEPAQTRPQTLCATPDMAPVPPSNAAEQPPAESPGRVRDALGERYVSDNFAYIRDLIHRNLSYPPMARRMGWEGKVIVSFVVNESGGVEDVKVVTGSGYAVLDQNAVGTIKMGAPYPRPPVSATLLMPVTYRLE